MRVWVAAERRAAGYEGKLTMSETELARPRFCPRTSSASFS